MKENNLAYLAIVGGLLLFISLLKPYISYIPIPSIDLVMPIAGDCHQHHSGIEMYDTFNISIIASITLLLGLMGGILSILAGILILQNKRITISYNELVKEMKLKNAPAESLSFENFQPWMLILIGGVFSLITVISWLLLEYKNVYSYLNTKYAFDDNSFEIYNDSIIGFGFFIFIIGTCLILASGILLKNQNFLYKRKQE